MRITISEQTAGIRLDKALSLLIADVSRSEIQAWIKDNRVTTDSRILKASDKLTAGSEIKIDVPEAISKEVLAENIPLDIIYEDEHLMVINKPQGMVVHPGAGHHSGTLVNALMYYSNQLSEMNNPERRGIVHRIDKDTSGLLIVAKTNKAHRILSDALSRHEIVRVYEAIVYGFFQEKAGVIDAPIARDKKNRKKMTVHLDGRPAVTHFRVIAPVKYGTYIQLRLETGRTHQIRAHMKYIDHPVLADPVYAPKRKNFGLQGQCLHARALLFKHPITGEAMHFEAPLPNWFEKTLITLGYDDKNVLNWDEDWLQQEQTNTEIENIYDDEEIEE